MGARSRDWSERFKWFWRGDRSGAEQLPPGACKYEIPIDSTDPRLRCLYMGLADGRWVVRRWFGPEELGYRLVPPPPAVIGHLRAYAAIPPSPNDRIYPPVEPGFHQIEVAASDVASDLTANGISLPPELADAFRIRPRWDRNGPPYRLWYGEALCLDFSRKAGPQFFILNAFQDAGWPESIDRPTNDKGSPLTDEQIKNAISNIQKGLKNQTAPIWIEGQSRLKWSRR
jgi:hypothetical protein